MKDVIVACDFESEKNLYEFLSKLKNVRPYLKIGMELFYAESGDLIKKLKEDGYKIFLDLKLHDIPNTVEKTMRVLSKLNVDIVNIHAAGTSKMMQAAKKAIDESEHKPLLIAVTQLTSISEAIMQNEILIDKKIDDVIISYAKNAKKNGLDGVVCSALEAKKIHSALGSEFLTICPGIKFENDKQNDQVRVVSPKEAKHQGADYIVVGRAITEADDPLKAYNKCLIDGGIL